MKHALVALFAVLCGCGPQFKPETLVEKLRVLAVTSNPPEVRPGESAELGVLQLDPARPAAKTTVVWVGCDPDPFDLGRSSCNDTSALLQPTSFTDFPPGVKILGFGLRAGYTPPKSLFDALAPDDRIRHNGTVGQVLAVVIGEEVKPTSSNEELRALFTRIEKREVQTLLAVTRITVSEKPALNLNPELDGIELDDARLPKNATWLLEPGQKVALRATAPESHRERYELRLPSGIETRTESLVLAWYSTSGRFSAPRVNLDEDEGRSSFIAPGSREVPDDPVPDKRSGTVWSVLRDSRGGQSWQQHRFYVCDAAAPAPKVEKIVLPASRDEAVEVTGQNMGSALDIVVGPLALSNGSFSNGRNAFLGDYPALPSGSYRVRVRAKNCADADTGLTVVVP